MKSRISSSNSIRAPGQRSIPSTFLFRPLPNCSSISEKGSGAPSIQGSGGGRSRLSLSAFLDRKLHPKIEKGKVSSSQENEHPNGSVAGEEQNRFDRPPQENRLAIEESVFKRFNNKPGEVREASPEGITEVVRVEGDVKQSNTHVVVLGDDPKPKRRACGLFSQSRKRPRPFYNHYKSGTGWWDSGREGIDEDEVGSKDIWEGMGSTSLGGLTWD